MLKLLLLAGVLITFPIFNTQQDFTLSFDYLTTVDKKKEEVTRSTYATTIRFYPYGSENIIIYMEEDPPVKFSQIGKVESLVEDGESFKLRKLKVSDKNTYVDLYHFDSGIVILDNPTTGKTLIFTNH